MRKLILAAAACALLSGCAGTSVADAIAALKDDPNSACVHVENSYPPFQNKFTLLRLGTGGTAMGVGTDCAGIQGGGATPTVLPQTVATQPVTPK